MRTVDVALDDRSYEIRVGTAMLDRVGSHVASILTPGAALLVSDEVVAGFYLERVERSLRDAGFRVAVATVPSGEPSKSHQELLRLYDACFAAGLERGSAVVALGGGVVGDLAGFAAATYLRGVRLVQVPTTLLAQVDSSVGGKTGINLAGGKNLVGAFHQPVLVIADVEALESLGEREMSTGMAEVVKHAVIRDAELFDRLEAEPGSLLAREPDALEEVVAWNCRIKADVVAADEREAGLRAILNYGHTVGHAIERVASYGAYTHGEAVAIGMHAEAFLARQRGEISEAVHDRQRKLLERFGLGTCLREPLEVSRLLGTMRHDKKVRGGRVRFVLPREIGSVRIADDLAESELRRALEFVQP